MKLHLPVFLRKAVLACMSAGVVFYCTVASATLVMADELAGLDAEISAAETTADTGAALSENTLSEVVYSGKNREGIDLTSDAGSTLIIFALDDADNNTISKNYFAGNATVVTSVPVQIGATGGDGTTGLVITDGNSSNHQIFTGTLTGNGIIKKVGAGTDNAFSFIGDTTGFSGNVYLKSDSNRAFTLTFGTVTSGEQTYTGVAGSTSAESGIIGNGEVTFIGSNANHKLVFNYAATDPVYITNTFDFTGTTDGYIELNGSADYIITQDISDITRFKKNTTGSVRADGNATFNVASGSVSTAATHILAGGTLIKTGAGELKIAHELNYGNIVIKEGTLFWQSGSTDYGTTRINAEQLTIESGAVFKISQDAGDHSQLDIVTKGGELFVRDLRGSVTFGTLDMQADATLRYTYNSLVNFTGVTGTGNLTIDVSSDANNESKVTNLGHLDDYTGSINISEAALGKNHAAQLGVDRVTLSEGKTLTLGYAITSTDFVKNGAGELRLSGVTLNAQSATVTGGSFTLTDGASLASSTVTVQDGAALKLDAPTGTSVSLSGALAGSGSLVKTGAGSATVGSVADSFAGSIALQGGSLNLGDSFLLSEGRELSVGMYDAVLESTLTLGAGKLSVDASGTGAATSLNNAALTLLGGTQLQLSGGNGGVYDLFTGISGLLGADGSAFELTEENNAIANYFDTTRPGSGFWAGATLMLNNGTLQLVRHNETVKDAVTITTRQTNGADYQYYAGVSFENITNSSSESSVNGGAIAGNTITLNNNGSVTFSGNTASASFSSYGGAIYGVQNSTISLSHNGSVTFIGNEASSSPYRGAFGGAIYGDSHSTVTLSNNGSVVFEGNTASTCGAISGDTITLSNNGIEVLELVVDIARGGAISGDTVTLSNNGSVVFEGNTASSFDYAYGGAIDGSTIDLNNNASVLFNENTASHGGAISGFEITLNGNGSVEFSGNSASYDSVAPRGGAISGDTITLSNNGSVVFEGNTSSYEGGAIYGNGDITLSDNGEVTFSGNTASVYGGAISGVEITLNGNGSVEFSGNSASGYGGAIYTIDNLSICNNDSVLFEKNAEKSGSSYRLSSIYADCNDDEIFLSAAAGKSIEFRDSVYIGSLTNAVNLNADYTDAEGVIHKQAGDIIFTGAYTEAHLNELLAADGAERTATEEEILNSRTTEVNALTNLYGGRLRVEDSAIYKGRGIMVHEGSEATVRVKDATLSHSGYDLTFNAGTTLELEGISNITGNVQMLEGSTMRLKNAVVVNGVILPDFNAGTTLELVGANSITGDVRMLEGSTLRLVFDDPTANKLELQLSDTLTLKAGSQVQRAGADGKVTLLGDGTLRMEGSADFSAFSVGNTWTGTVSLADITTEADLKMTTIGQAGSFIELENAKGYTGAQDKTVEANLVLNKSTAADGTEQAAFLVSDGYSSTTEDYVMTTFSGAVSGAGKMVFDKTLSLEYTGFKFTGNVKAWTGAFEMNAGKTFNLVFGGNATEINAAVLNNGTDTTLNLKLEADAATAVNGQVDVSSIAIGNDNDVSFDGTVETDNLAAGKGIVKFAADAEVRDSFRVNAGAEVQIQSGARLQNRAVALSAAPGTAAATLSSKADGDLVVMLQDAQFSIQDMLLVNTSISAEQGTSVMLAGVQDSRNVHLQGGGDFALTFANNKAEVGMAVIENSSPVSGLTLSAGSSLTLVMDPSNNLCADYSLIINMTGFEYEGGNLAAAGGITELNAAGIYLGGWLGQLLADQGVAQESAGALEAPVVTGDSVPSISYTYSTENNVGMVISISGLSVPEPTTTTLSLLALAALAARRRRK